MCYGHMMKNLIIGSLATTILLVLGINLVSQFKSNSQPPRRSQDFIDTLDSSVNKTDATVSLPNTLATNYYEYSTDVFEAHISSNQGAVLFFYANWCPTCAAQEPLMVKVMNANVSKGKTAIRVNFNDSDTDQAEKDLAKKYGVTYQHTFVVIDKSGND